MAIADGIPVRERRNHVSEVLRRVLLVPKPGRPRTASTRQYLATMRQEDPGLRAELAAELTEMTDELPDPWRR